MNGDGVIIVGGGWAGLAAALELQRHAIPVTLYESAPQLGGRARNAPFGELTVDNGQHLLIGAYHETLRLLSLCGAREEELFLRQPLALHVIEGAEALALTAPPLPAPLHLAWALLTARGVPLRDRLSALRMSLRLQLAGFSLEHDCSVADLLQRHHQSPLLIRRLWEPLCLATLNTPLAHASATVFLRVLCDSFSHRHHDADLLIPRLPLGDLFPATAARYLQGHGAETLLRRRITGLRIADGKLQGLECRGEEIPCREAVLAVAPHSAVALLEQHVPLAPLARDIASLGAQPIATVYLQFPPEVTLPQPMVGMSGTLSQWVFDRRHAGQAGVMAVIISAEGEHDGWEKERLAMHVAGELAHQFPSWPQPLQIRVIRERRATFECHVGCEARRPANTTQVDGLWLAGDYTSTGYPATLEGAVRSGVECAHRIVARRKTNPEKR